MPPNQRANRYDHTPRKVFDKAIDRMELKRLRDREDHRTDLHLLMNRLKALQLQLDLLEDHVKSHCHVLRGEDEKDELTTNGTEELE